MTDQNPDIARILVTPQQIQIRLRMEGAHAPEVVGEETVEILLLPAVQEQADIQAFVADDVRDVAHQKERAGFRIGLFRHDEP